jgi:hypothetical protein
VTYEFELRVIEQMTDIVLCTRKKIINAEYVVSALDQAITKMGAEKARTTGDYYPFSVRPWFHNDSLLGDEWMLPLSEMHLQSRVRASGLNTRDACHTFHSTGKLPGEYAARQTILS